MSSLGPSKLGIFIQSWRRTICLDKVFQLPVLVPSCFESLFQLQPGKDPLYSMSQLCLQKLLFVGEISVQLSGKYGFKSPQECWGDVTLYFGSHQGDPSALISLCFLCSFGLCKVFLLLHSFPPFLFLFRLTPWKTFHFLMDALTELFWLKSLCRTLQKWHQNITTLRPRAFPAH